LAVLLKIKASGFHIISKHLKQYLATFAISLWHYWWIDIIHSSHILTHTIYMAKQILSYIRPRDISLLVLPDSAAELHPCYTSLFSHTICYNSRDRSVRRSQQISGSNSKHSRGIFLNNWTSYFHASTRLAD